MTAKKPKNENGSTNGLTKDEFVKYEKVRASGKTNMFDLGKVTELSGLPKGRIIDIMQNYGACLKLWPDVRVK